MEANPQKFQAIISNEKNPTDINCGDSVIKTEPCVKLFGVHWDSFQECWMGIPGYYSTNCSSQHISTTVLQCGTLVERPTQPNWKNYNSGP
jgi:hypothetical protein